MNEINNLAYILSVLCIVVFVLNVLPAFAPPTWTTMSFIGLAIPKLPVYCLRTDLPTNYVLGHTLLYRTLCELRVLDQDCVDNW
jgi:hypothetical protein